VNSIMHQSICNFLCEYHSFFFTLCCHWI
jgi:hypothetical protein